MALSTAKLAWFFVGNPGAGKSTLANATAKEVFFKSGLSFGGGLTKGLDIKFKDSVAFVDTPGLADAQLRKQAGEAISEALKQGGKFKIIFVCLQVNGRVRTDDITTIQVVLESCDEIEAGKFGIVVNQCGPKFVEGMAKRENFDQFTMCLQNPLVRKTNFFTFIVENPTLKEMEDKLVPMDQLAGFEEFVNSLPIVTLTPDRANNIKDDAFEDMKVKMEAQDRRIDKLLEEKEQGNKEAMDEIEAMKKETKRMMEELQAKNAKETGSPIWDVVQGVVVPLVTAFGGPLAGLLAQAVGGSQAIGGSPSSSGYKK